MAKSPNILFLLPDQLRADFLGCYGATFVRTPNIDRLAADGLLFERCLSSNPICVPARASMLTVQARLKPGCWQMSAGFGPTMTPVA